MTKKGLELAVAAAKANTRECLQVLYDSLNAGQRKKILKDDLVADLLETYEVIL